MDLAHVSMRKGSSGLSIRLITLSAIWNSNVWHVTDPPLLTLLTCAKLLSLVFDVLKRTNRRCTIVIAMVSIEDVASLKVAELKEELKKLALPVAGLKAVLAARLIDALKVIDCWNKISKR